MPKLKLTALSLRYSSWTMRPWLALTHAGLEFDTDTRQLAHMQGEGAPPQTLDERREMGSVRGLFPVLWIGDRPVHESLAICEWVADTCPDANLWPADTTLRAQARAVSCEMLSGFADLRNELPCHLFARVPGFSPSGAAQSDIDRVFEIWSTCLQRSGGPFLFGAFGIADAMYFPVLTRFRTYGIELPEDATAYAGALETQPAVQTLMQAARGAPRTPVYDELIEKLGGNPVAGL